MKRKFKLLFCFLLIISLLVGCTTNDNSSETNKNVEGGQEVAKEGENAGLQSGIFEGRGNGLKSEIVVNVKIEDSKIVDIHIVEEDDTVFIADKVYEQLPKKIIEHQSVGVDMVSGATFTSMGVLTAVENALESAKIDIASFKDKINFDFEPAEGQEYDVVIVGGGAAGLTAGIGLMTDDELGLTDSGLNVLLLEKLAYTGGSIRVSDGVMMALNNTPYNDLIGKSLDNEDLITYAKSIDVNNYMNESLFRKVLNHAPKVYSGLLNRGFYLPPENTVPGYIHGDPNHGLHFVSEIDGSSDPLNLECAYFFTVRDPYTGEAGFRKEEGFNYGTNGGSPWLAQSLENAARLAGVEIRTSATVENLILDGDIVVGVHVKDKNNYTEYDVKAKKVIVATGLLGADKETMKKWSNEDGLKAPHFGCAGHQGDGHVWAEELGGTIFNGEQNHFILGFDQRLGQYGESTILHRTAPSIWVNKEGKRFFNEGVEKDVYADYGLLNQPDNIAFGIIDSESEYLKYMDYIIERNVGWKADTIEELAGLIKVPYEELNVTIKKYNDAYDEGKDDEDFGTLNENMASVKKGPFYAFQVRSLNNATDASVKVDDNFKVLREDGSTVDGVYYAGSIVVSNYGFMDGGFSHMTALTSGSYVANLIRAELTK